MIDSIPSVLFRGHVRTKQDTNQELHKPDTHTSGCWREVVLCLFAVLVMLYSDQTNTLSS